MKIALAQRNYLIGDFSFNTQLILQSIEEAKKNEAGLVVFAELSVCGYPPRDFLEFKDFLNRCKQSVDFIAAACTGIAAIIGAPAVNPDPRGKNLFNAAWFLADGKIQQVVHKTLLPNYDVFDEYRYFEPNRDPFQLIDYKGVKIALTICEDLWNLDDDPMYLKNPMDELIKLHPDLMINIAASPFHIHQPRIRNEVMSKNALRYHLPLIYVNQVGAQTELLFDGGSMVVSAEGVVLDQIPRFQEGMLYFDTTKPSNTSNLEGGSTSTNKKNKAGSPGDEVAREDFSSVIADMHDALVMGIRDFFKKMGFQKAILGLSGGIDSAVTLVLAVEALGPGNVLPVLLPSRYSSDHSIADAKQLAVTLGTSYEIIPIEEAHQALGSMLDPQLHGLDSTLTDENMQARIRAVILMALANQFGYILLNTSNKSEAAVGYGTIYGDMCGGISVLGDVYKIQVYELARYINRNREIIPENSITKPPSAELRPDQKDSDSLPPYEILDKVLHAYIEERKGPDELIASGFEPDMISRILKLVNTNEWKRHQTPPILRVSGKAFGMGRRMPIVARYLG